MIFSARRYGIPEAGKSRLMHLLPVTRWMALMQKILIFLAGILV
jgi:hypothetical protein